MKRVEVAELKSGYLRRAAVLALVAFGGCAVFDHRHCVEYPGIFGPCSWAHSARIAAGVLAGALASMVVLMVAVLWVAGIVPFKRRKQ